MAAVSWKLNDGVVSVLTDNTNGWSGSLESRVSRLLLVPDSDDAIVLLSGERRPPGVLAWHPFPNVVRLAPSGAEVWRSELVPGETAAKCWHRIDWDGSRLLAWTYSWTCELDPVTGRILASRFDK